MCYSIIGNADGSIKLVSMPEVIRIIARNKRFDDNILKCATRNTFKVICKKGRKCSFNPKLRNTLVTSFQRAQEL